MIFSAIQLITYYSALISSVKLCHLQENDGTGDHHVKRDKQDRDKQIITFFLLYVELKKQNDKKKKKAE
jgi:hypothetical protein